MLVRRLVVPAAVVTGLLLAAAAPVQAQQAPAPERTASYTAASGGGLAAPQPTVNEGDLRISRSVRTESFATLLYRASGVRAALDVTIRDVPPPAGTPDVVACPTVGTEWKAGPSQPIETAPEVDCSAALAFGSLSEDATTLSFALDPAFQVSPGVWSIALLPQPQELQVVVGVPNVPTPFSLDLAAPEAGSFVAESEFVLPDLESPPGDLGTSDSGSGSSGDAFFPAFEPPAFDAGTGTGIAEAAPLVAGGDQAALPQPAAPAPAVAGARPPRPPVLLAQPAALGEDVGTGRRLLGLLVLAGGSAAVGYAAGQQRPGPRLIGGRARALPAGAAVPAGGAPAPEEERPRGIGRFARVRDAAPRRLR